MVIPGLYDVPRVVAESSLTEEDVLNLGLGSDGIVFMVVVPELGACRVPDVALSHFMAGADEYAADAMPEHWSKQPSGPWTIKRDRLRILADSWEKHLILIDRIQAALEPAQDTATPAPVVAAGASVVVHSTKVRRDTLTPVIELAQKQCRNPQDTAEVWAALLVLAENKQSHLLGATEDGLQYLNKGSAAIFTKRSLSKRLAR